MLGNWKCRQSYPCLLFLTPASTFYARRKNGMHFTPDIAATVQYCQNKVFSPNKRPPGSSVSSIICISCAESIVIDWVTLHGFIPEKQQAI